MSLSTLSEYLQVVRSVSNSSVGQGKSQAEIAVALEDSREFDNLRRELETLTRGEVARKELASLMRRLGVYTNLKLDDSSLTTTLLDWFSGSGSIEKTHLLSLPWIDHHSAIDLSFGPFRLRSLSHNALTAFLEAPIRRAFYPDLIVPEERIWELSYETYLEFNESMAVRKAGFRFDFSLVGNRLRLSDIPESLHRALRRLVLPAWEHGFSEGSTDLWFPGLPLGTHLTKALNEPCGLPRCLDVQAYEYVGHDDPEVFPFAQIIQQITAPDLADLPRIHDQLDWVESNEGLRFVQRAVDLLVRASTSSAHRWTGKLDQFLYHVFSLDACFGQIEKGDKLSRLAVVLLKYYQREASPTDVAAVVKDLYRIRSEIVHGKPIDEIPTELSWKARSVTRSVTRALLHLVYEHRIVSWREYARKLKSLLKE